MKRCISCTKEIEGYGQLRYCGSVKLKTGCAYENHLINNSNSYQKLKRTENRKFQVWRATEKYRLKPEKLEHLREKAREKFIPKTNRRRRSSLYSIKKPRKLFPKLRDYRDIMLDNLYNPL